MELLDNYIQALDRLFELGLIETKPSLLAFNAGEIVFHAQEPAPMIFGVKTGEIQLHRYLETGQQGIQYVVGGGEWLGEGALFNGVYQNSAIATHPSQILAVSTAAFLTLLRHDPDSNLRFIAQMTEQLNTAKTLMTVRCLRLARDRVLEYLRLLKPPHTDTYCLDRSLKDIAEQICLSPEVVSRALRKLQDEGIIHRNHRKITFR